MKDLAIWEPSCAVILRAPGPRYPQIHNTLSVRPPVSSNLLKWLLAMYVNAVNLRPRGSLRGSLFALFTLPMCHLTACDIYNTFIQSCAKRMDFIERDLFLLFSLPLVSSPFRGASLCVCVFPSRNRHIHARRTSLLRHSSSPKLFRSILTSSSCAAETLLNTDPKPQVTSPNPAH